MEMYILSKEDFLVNLLCNYSGNNGINEFLEEKNSQLINNPNVIDLDGDAAIIFNYSYKQASSMFGSQVCNRAETNVILAEIISNKLEEIDYYDALEIITNDNPDEINWLLKQTKIQLLQTVGNCGSLI